MQKKSSSLAKFAKVSLGLAACAAVTVTAYAAVFYSDADTIFVGKGDVQASGVCKFNNAQAQRFLENADDKDWKVDLAGNYLATCSFVTGAGTPGEQTHHVQIPRHVVGVTVAYDPRKVNQVSGIFLQLEAVGTRVPVVGEACVANDRGVARNGTWTAVTPQGNTGSGDVYVDCTANGNPTTLIGTPTPL
jgi:hypothetical protein